MKNLIVHKTIKSIAYLSLVFFAFVNPYLMDGFVRMLMVYLEQIISA